MHNLISRGKYMRCSAVFGCGGRDPDRPRGVRGRTRLATVIALTGALIAVQPAVAPAASAVTGIYKVSSISTTSSTSPKVANAYCRPGDRVIGGGGWVHETGAETRRIALTQLQPFQFVDGSQEGYTASGAETAPGTADSWWVQAYAVCAPDSGQALDVEVRAASSSSSSAGSKTAAATCPEGKRVLGTGARLNGAVSGQVVLQGSRASGSGRSAHAQAQETSGGYSGVWSVVSYAICANPPPGYQVVWGPPSEYRASEAQKSTTAFCPPGTRVHGAGATIIDLDIPEVSLKVVYPSDALGYVSAVAVENTPTARNWDFIHAQAICAY